MKFRGIGRNYSLQWVSLDQRQTHFMVRLQYFETQLYLKNWPNLRLYSSYQLGYFHDNSKPLLEIVCMNLNFSSVFISNFKCWFRSCTRRSIEKSLYLHNTIPGKCCGIYWDNAGVRNKNSKPKNATFYQFIAKIQIFLLKYIPEKGNCRF